MSMQQQREINQLRERIEKLEARLGLLEEKRGPGRPRKTEED